MDEAEKKKIAIALSSRIPDLTCPMCHHKQFTLIDGYFAEVIQNDLGKIRLDGQHIPLIGVVCSHCGYVSFHAAGVLGLLNKTNKQENQGDTSQNSDSD